MLAKSFRLPSSTIFKHAHMLQTRFFRVMVVPNTFTYNRFGFVVSKKVDKRAVVRNRIKRVLQASVVDSLENKKGRDILFIAKPAIGEAGTAIVANEVWEALKNV